MIQPNPFKDSCPYPNHVDSSLDDDFLNNGVNVDDIIIMNCFESSTFSPPFTTTDHDSLETSSTNFASAMSIEFDIDNFPFHVDEMQVAFPVDGSSVLDLDDLDPSLNIQIEEMRDWLEGVGHQESDSSYDHQLSIDQDGNIWTLSQSMISSDTSTGVTSIQPTLHLPTEDMEINDELAADHLAKAYGEAMENEQRELAEVIMRRINEKVRPVGEIRERLFYHSFQPLDKQAADNYLKQESCKIFDAAFEAIYRMFPNGMFAHFTANSAILEAIPDDAEVLHIVDFDMGEGVQWASMVVALAQQQNLRKQFGRVFQEWTLKLTSVKWMNEDCICGHVHPNWRIENTKKRLIDYANSNGLKLKVEEMELQDLVSEMKKMKRKGTRREWLAFNCMSALPHMGRRRRTRHVMEFLRVAKDFLTNSANNKTDNTGIITFGDGDTWEKTQNCSCFGSFFDSSMEHYQALLESMEWNFPIHLAEARIAMECLFVAPYVSSLSLLEKWKEIKVKKVCEFDQPGFGRQGVRLSSESLMEAKVMVREGESLYTVRIEGESANEMVLEWRETPLVRVSAWR